MNIAKKMIHFAKPFIEEYVNSLISGNLDNEVTAEEFKKKFDKWLETNNKQEEYTNLCNDIKIQIDDFCKEQLPEKQRLGFGKIKI